MAGVKSLDRWRICVVRKGTCEGIYEGLNAGEDGTVRRAGSEVEWRCVAESNRIRNEEQERENVCVCMGRSCAMHAHNEKEQGKWAAIACCSARPVDGIYTVSNR